MTEFEQKTALFEAWLEENNKRIGEISIAQVGEYPVNISNFYGSVVNEMATADLIRHYADAHGDRNPLWRNPEYAKSTRWGGIVAPPTFTDSIIQAYPFKFEPPVYAQFNYFLQMPVGCRREIYKPIYPGDTFHCIHRYMGMQEIPSRFPAPVREFEESIQRQLINQRGEIVAIIEVFDIGYLNFDSVMFKPRGRKRHKLTDVEAQNIIKGYENEKRRGAEPLYWEDVEVGAGISLHSIGPYNAYDTAAFYTAMSGHALAFELEWERIKLFPDFAWKDPELNFYTSGGVCHLADGKGDSAMNDGFALGFYAQVDGLLGRMLCNWAGDNAFVRVLDTRAPFETYPMLGDILNCSGKVVSKTSENGEYLVHLEVQCLDYWGTTLSSGTATVQLPSKVDFRGFRF